MKIYRLLGIINVLLQKEKVTAPYLAEKFEVSRRTINRDIEDICMAGIPVVTIQGSNGGIYIDDSYKIDKALFTDKEIQSILSGLATLDSIANDNKYRDIIDKFSLNKNNIYCANNMLIDLSSHYKNTLAPKINAINKAIDNKVSIQFTYHKKACQKNVVIDPYLIVFEWSSWYVLGLESLSDTFKLYKLNRICDLVICDSQFILKDIPEGVLSFHDYFDDNINCTILFDSSIKYRLIDEYGEDSFTVNLDGRLKFSSSFTNEDYLVEWLLSFGNKAEIIEPQCIRKRIKDILYNTYNIYN